MHVFLLETKKLRVVLFYELHKLLGQVIVLYEIGLRLVSSFFEFEVDKLELGYKVLLSLYQSLLIVRKRTFNSLTLTSLQPSQINIIKLQIINVELRLILEKSLVGHFLISLQVFVQRLKFELCSF